MQPLRLLLCLLPLLVPRPGPHRQVLKELMFWSLLEVVAAAGARREVGVREV
jgi:hypothetical protein